MALYALDIETTGLSRFSDRLLCIGVFDGRRGYRAFRTARAFLDWHLPDNQYILHGGKFDCNFLRHHGVDIRGSFSYDTHSISTLLVPQPTIAEGQKSARSLENLYIKLLGGSRYKLDRSNLSAVSDADLLAYNERDCRITWDLFNHLLTQLNQQDWQFVEDWLMPATHFVADMEYNGVFVDKEGLLDYKAVIADKRDKILQELLTLTKGARDVYRNQVVEELAKEYDEKLNKVIVKARDKEKARARYSALFETAKAKIEDFNFNSPSQLKWLLGTYYGLNLFNKRSEKETTDEAMLKSHADRAPVAKALLEYRELEKLLSTCIPALVDNCDVDGRIHPSFNIGGTRTGRLSSSGPNMQQVPKGPVRSYVKAAEGHQLFIADYAQIEVRVIAELAQEEELIHAFKEEIDPYSIIARNLFKLDCDVREVKARFPQHRNTAKTAGLSILYGTGAAKLQEVLKKDLGLSYNLQQCRAFIEDYRNSFPKVQAFKKHLEQALANQKKGYNLLGRPIYIENNDDLYMTALNTVVQGSASDLVIKAATNIAKQFPNIRPIMLVHDEMVFEISESLIDEDLPKQIEFMATKRLEEELKLSVPLKIEWTIAKQWEKP